MTADVGYSRRGRGRPTFVLSPSQRTELFGALCAALDTCTKDLLHPSRGGEAQCWRRQVAMYVSVTTLGLPRAEVARMFGRHGETVSHAIRIVDARCEKREVEQFVESVEAKIEGLGLTAQERAWRPTKTWQTTDAVQA